MCVGARIDGAIYGLNIIEFIDECRCAKSFLFVRDHHRASRDVITDDIIPLISNKTRWTKSVQTATSASNHCCDQMHVCVYL